MGKMETIRENVLDVYNRMTNEFRAPEFCLEVQWQMSFIERYPMDGTILRILRQTREDGLTPYIVKDFKKSIYIKKEEE